MRQLIPAAFLVLAACGGADEPAMPAEDESPLPVEPNGGIGDGATPLAQETAESGIPDALRGRWGLVKADCEPGRSDAKGLMTVSADKLEFYESVGKLGDRTERTPQSLRGSFEFTGEGMTWTRGMSLALQDDGTLERVEFGEGAAPDPFRYTKCA